MTTKILPMPLPGGSVVAYVIPGAGQESLNDAHQVFTKLLSAQTFGAEQNAEPSKPEQTAGSRTQQTNANYTQSMNEQVPRPELDAKLEAVEARMDARLERFDKDVRQVISDFKLEMAPLKNMKASIWGSTAVVVGTIIAAISMSFGAFDSGRETSKLVQEMHQQAAETRKLLEQIKAQQAATLPPATPAAAPPHEK